MNKQLTVLVIAGALGSQAGAAVQTVTLSVPGMTCAACPITVKKALTRIDGVMKAEVSFERLEAKVSFDDTKTNVQALTKATAGAGYPSEPKR